MNHDGTGPTQLTSDTWANTQACYGNDDTKIAFISQQTGNLDLFVMNADGTGRVNLTNDASYDQRPDWRPAAGYRDEFVTWNTNGWVGNYWCGNVDQGSWAPVVSGGHLDFSSPGNDVCVYEVRTATGFNPMESFALTLTPFLQSGLTNGDGVFIGLGPQWIGYGTADSAGVYLEGASGKIWTFAGSSGLIEHIGNFVAGTPITLILTWTPGQVAVCGPGMSGSVSRAILSTSPLSLIVSVANSSDGMLLDRMVVK